jgi:hypothetical protein
MDWAFKVPSIGKIRHRKWSTPLDPFSRFGADMAAGDEEQLPHVLVGFERPPRSLGPVFEHSVSPESFNKVVDACFLVPEDPGGRLGGVFGVDIAHFLSLRLKLGTKEGPVVGLIRQLNHVVEGRNRGVFYALLVYKKSFFVANDGSI